MRGVGSNPRPQQREASASLVSEGRRGCPPPMVGLLVERSESRVFVFMS